MDLNFSVEDVAFREEVRTFLASSLPDYLCAKMIKRLHLTKDETVHWQRILNARGWATPSWPVDCGGQSWSPSQRYIFQEEMALAHAPETQPFNVNMIGPILAKFGTDEQKAKFLRSTANLDIWWCQGFSEPGAGSDLASLKTSAVRDGNHYLINGQKIWTTQAQNADWMFALVRTDSSGRKQEGISFLLIDMTTHGITVRPIETIDGGHDANEVFFDDVRVPTANLIGEEGKGWTYAKHLLGNERSGIARIGLSKERLKQLRSLEHELSASGQLDERETVGLKRKLAEVEVQLRALELTQLRVVSADAHGANAGAAASILKIKGTELQQRMTELVLELAGPEGLALAVDDHTDGSGGWQNPAAQFYFTMRKVSIFGGSNEIQKNIIAKTMLGL
ncbi:pimeloyl-CoA dehydrogenase large subunit [Croceicoccus ponticola]|uniref:Pimeloyl-CoA dehydrogenase large subunit n=1 Tax=Croceicoccus ponticola TaxID=2217664 RepID=A0A437H252_9SPHN|nr:acyl-CoA dehydrogenase family protein [Croceicoccus ponticola]RVQ69669.1 pimeloyl-CoA dehydrogenase large subunit [Croceicoccus ponticola]